MRPTERSQAIAFLLSFGAIPLGCPAEDDDDTGGSSNPSTTVGTNPSTTDSAGTDSAGTDSASTDPTNSSSNPTLPTTDPSASASATLSTDPSDPTQTTDPDTGYGTYGSSGYGYNCDPASIPPVCVASAMKTIECNPKYAPYSMELQEQCACAIEYYAAMYGPACATAIEDYYSCLNALACGDITEDSCPDEVAAASAACSGGGAEGG